MRTKEYIYRTFLVWYFVGIILVAFDLLPESLEWANAVFLYLAGIVTFIYAGVVYGWSYAIQSFLIVLFISIGAEHLGVKYGLIFGEYYYEKDFGIQVFGVPLTIGFAWYMVIMTTHAISKKILNPLYNFYFIKYIGLTSLLAVIMDLIIDPVAFKAKEYWIWNGDSFYYDIPLNNFFGWFLVSMIIQIVLFPIWKKKSMNLEPRWEKRIRILYFLIIFMFVLTALQSELYLAMIVVLLSIIPFLLLLQKGDNIRDLSKEE
ncbi:carotenoid biosynthesis protein [Bacillus sp. 31A1R]|uniref:Carotenoid biosynthesis protein n=1 Tax=Robertmurraya mangrovi TaxID=3098077 RepID=A0ABU5J331_9BACI|nr:carotenoid biosynthesis protein [Bacillus sp. 31A1R]MDZ5473825.1 carotenoid biosynthesis protein [Bacillus sp. 31A1R]